MKKTASKVLTMLIATSSLCYAQKEMSPIDIRIDHRGLVKIPGILRTNSKTSWGAHNLVIRPNNEWSAQDYCLKNIKKSGEVISGDFRSKPDLKMVETVTKVKSTDGTKPLKVHYKLTPADGKPVTYDTVYIFFPFASEDFENGKVLFDGGSELILSEEGGMDASVLKSSKTITIVNDTTAVTIKTDNMNIVFKDMRPKSSSFQIWLEYPNPENTTLMEFDFEISASTLPYVIDTNNTDWVELPHQLAIEKNSIVDFSFMSDGPAGKYGRIINKDGHYAYEKTGERVKLIGANLCYTANYLEKEEANKLAEQFKKMGYNTVRFHHTDVYLIKGNWSSNKSDDINPEYLDKLDYMFSAMKNAGMYVTIDLYAQGKYDIGEIEGIDTVINKEIKGLIPIYEPAFDAWKKMVVKWMNHVNPYTGIAWKDDPALITICPVNEDTIFPACWDDVNKPLYEKAFKDWKQENNLKSDEKDLKKDPLFAEFLLEVKMKSNKKVEEFLRDLGIKSMLTGSNWGGTMAQTFTRNQFDVVDNHRYSDHPSPYKLPSKYKQQHNFKPYDIYMTPNFMGPSRIFGKPFVVTEYNYCAPNQYRAEGGALMGAYASLQDWDALYRFAWSHGAARVNTESKMSGFDMSTDPLSQMTEKQIVLLFRRGDVQPAEKKYVFGVTMEDAVKGGLGNMWKQGLFPKAFTALGFTSQVGSQLIDGQNIQGVFDGVVTINAVTNSSVLDNNKNIVVKDLPAVSHKVTSDTEEISMDADNHYFKVNTSKSDSIVAFAESSVKSGNLVISNNTTFCSVSASSMDDNDLNNSKRILLLYLTNVLNNKETFAASDMKILANYGELPYIIKTGSVDILLKNSNSKLKLYACGSSGKRVKEIDTEYINGAYTFKLEISADTPYMIYELNE
ncbi:MAG: cellulase family glycosylhydrolase [Kiritimatiellae bacterium]|jgi:hypothetical protein|nr:cellulase family glycosylhydrolase [Kiritimatiellia bacterium]